MKKIAKKKSTKQLHPSKNRQLAIEIANELFTSGINLTAKRLVLMSESNNDMGSWSNGRVIDVIQRILDLNNK
jgi:hypothetical protein